MLNAVCCTLVMANPTLSANDVRTASSALIALIELIKKNGFRDLTIPLEEIVWTVGGDDRVEA